MKIVLLKMLLIYTPFSKSFLSVAYAYIFVRCFKRLQKASVCAFHPVEIVKCQFPLIALIILKNHDNLYTWHST